MSGDRTQVWKEKDYLVVMCLRSPNNVGQRNLSYQNAVCCNKQSFLIKPAIAFLRLSLLTLSSLLYRIIDGCQTIETEGVLNIYKCLRIRIRRTRNVMIRKNKESRKISSNVNKVVLSQFCVRICIHALIITTRSP